MKIIGFALSLFLSVLICVFLFSVFGIDGDCTLALHVCAYATIYRELCKIREGE